MRARRIAFETQPAVPSHQAGDHEGVVVYNPATDRLALGTATAFVDLAAAEDWDADIATHEADTTVHGAHGAVVGTTNSQTLTNKTLTTPTIGDFTNATHNHSNAAGGGTIAHTALTSIGTNTHATIDSFIGDVKATTFVTRTASGVLDSEFALDSLNSGVLMTDGSGTITDSNPLLRGQLDTTGSTPTITALSAAGSTAAIASVAGNDICGFFQLTPGGAGIGIGSIVTIDFAVDRPDTSYTVVLVPHSDAARIVGGVVGPTNRSIGSVDIATRTALTSGSAYQWAFLIVGY